MATQNTPLLNLFGLQKMQQGAEGETGQRFYNRDSFKNTAANLAMGLNSMRLNPDASLPQRMQAQIAQRGQNRTRNRTVEALRKKAEGGDKLAAKYLSAIESGALPVAQAMSAYMQEGSQLAAEGRAAARARAAAERAANQPLSQIAKLRADLANKRITQEDFDAQLMKLTYIAPAKSSAIKTLVFGDKLISVGEDGTTQTLMENTDPAWRTVQGSEIEDAKEKLGLEGVQTLGLFSVKGEGDKAEYKFSPLKSGGDTNIEVVTGGSKQGLPNTDAIEDLNKKYGADLLKWVQAESSDSQKLIAQLETVSTALASGKDNLTGPVVSLFPDRLRAITEAGRESINTREAVEEVVQRNLKLILGGQFTEREGEKLVARAFNEKLQEGDNLVRVNRLLSQLKAAASAKQAMADHFMKNGTLAGFDQSRIPTFEDFNLLMDTMDKQQLSSNAGIGDTISDDSATDYSGLSNDALADALLNSPPGSKEAGAIANEMASRRMIASD